MNIVIFASDTKSLSSLNNVASIATDKGHNIVLMYATTTQLQYPWIHKDSFETVTNVTTPTESVQIQSMGITLPFKPDWLIVNRERWAPELQIIQEFKQLGAKVGVVEANAAMLNNAESFMETHSKNKFSNIVDVFFTHSSFIATQQKLQGFAGNMYVTGNPKYDTNLKRVGDASVLARYNIDPTKKKVLLFSLVNNSRAELYNMFREYINQHPDYQYFIKPYPGEPWEEKFQSDYWPEFCIPNVTPILNETDIWDMFAATDIHIGAFSSIFHASMLLDKEIIDVSAEIGMRKRYESNIDSIIDGTGSGIESQTHMWMQVMGVSNKENLRQILSTQIPIIIQNNDYVWNIVDNSLYSNKEELLKLFDDWNDGNASSRIIDYLEKHA